MALRDGNPFYFMFSRDDQTQINATKIVVSDTPYSSDPLVSDPYPQSLRIEFPATRAPKLRPISPGLLTFRFDPQPGLQPPDPKDAVIENYDKWPTVGRVRLEVEDDKVITRIKDITGLPIGPNEIWYSSVKITKNFLFESLKKLPVGWLIGGEEHKVDPSTPEGLRLAVSGFLKGRFFARLVSGRQSSEDSQSIVEMPELAPKAPGSFDFYITTGFTRKPFDGEEKHYENPNSVTDKWEPAHPRNGIIPARLIYRNLRTHTSGNLIDGDVGNPVPDKILAANPTDPAYYPVRFTRIWLPEEDWSIHFPSQVVSAKHLATDNLISQRLPAHGIFFFTLSPAQAELGRDYSVSVSNPTQRRMHEMRWLLSDGPDDNSYLRTASVLPVTVTPPVANQTLGTLPHIILRRRMSQEIIYDRKHRPKGFGPACTYFSLRRTVRALVNNRITGGRLNFEVYYNRNNSLGGKHTQATIFLLKAALGDDADKVLKGQPNHRAGENLPRDQQIEAIKTEALKCRSLFERFFPEYVEPIPPGDPGVIPQKGKVAYNVWQTIYANFQASSTRRFYLDGWVAGGGAGALIALSLADQDKYRVNPGETTKRETGETSQSYRSRIVEDMLAGNLVPGAPLQFWENFADLDALRARNASLPPPDGLGLTGRGHSPIFLRYIGPPTDATGIVVIDQTGEQECQRTGEGGAFILPWGHIPSIDAWIATNWKE